MARTNRDAPGWRRALAIVLALLAGCRARPPLEEAGVVVKPPPGWAPLENTSVRVPGVPLACWAGPEGSSLVVFRTLPAPGSTAEGLSWELANRLANLPDLRVESRGVEVVAGREAARVEVVAPGTGDALAPSGTGVPVAPVGKTLVPTRRISLGFPMPTETFWLTWHFPESDRGRVAPEVAATLKTLRIAGRASRSSSYD